MNLPWLQRFIRASLAVAVTLTITAAATASVRPASARPVAHAAGNCRLGGEYNKLGPTYVERLTVSNTSCATGVSLIKAYNACRLKAGGAAGHCTSKVLGFRCSEKRSSSPVQFVASVRCTKGREVVVFSYSENT
jgi:hypothetical protein